MKLVVVFLLTAFLPIICLGIRCNTCANPMSAECEKEPLVEVECVQTQNKEVLDALKIPPDFTLNFYCITATVIVNDKYTQKEKTVFVRDCIPNNWPKEGVPVGCRYSGETGERSDNYVWPSLAFLKGAAAGGKPIKGHECICDKDLCNNGDFPKIPSKSTGETKSMSLVACVITGFLSLAYLML